MQAFEKKKLFIGFLIGIAATVVLLAAGFVVLLGVALFGGEEEETRDISRYPEIQDYYIHSGFIVFPEEIPESAEETDYYFYYKDTFGSPTCEVYLQCIYSDADYEKEVARLENTYKSYGKQRRELLRDEEEKFEYPAYIAVENHHDEYEYALLTGENQITYIYTAYRNKKQVHFDQSYLPSDFMTDENGDFLGGYSIYICSESEDMIDYDYTREEIVPVTQTHMEQTSDKNAYFYVNTELDENEKEIITNCEYYYWESIYDEDPDITTYGELAGYEFCSLTMNEDRTRAIVRYLEDGEEKVWETDIPQK